MRGFWGPCLLNLRYSLSCLTMHGLISVGFSPFSAPMCLYRIHFGLNGFLKEIPDVRMHRGLLLLAL